MKKKHPIRRIFVFLLLAAIVAGLAAMPLLTAGSAQDENKASILAGVPERRTLKKTIYSGAPLASQTASAVEVPEVVYVTEFLVNTGDIVKEGDPVARVDDISVMAAVKSAQDALDSISSQLKSLQNKITPGVLTVDDSGKLCVGGKQIAESNLTYYTQFADLTKQHQEYEEMLLDLFRLHQTGVVTAPCDGIIGDVDKGQIKKLSASDGGRLMLLARNTPDGDDDTVYTCFSQWLTGFNEDGSWNVKWCFAPSVVLDFRKTEEVSKEFAEEEELWSPEIAFALVDGEWELYTPQLGDILMYAIDGEGSYWVIKIGHEALPEEEEPTEEPTDETTEPTDPDEDTDPTDPEEGETPTRPGSGGGGMGGLGSLGAMLGGARGGSSASQAVTLVSTEKTQLCTVTPSDIMYLELPIDEMDITKLQVGMTAEVTLEALPNRSFTAEITKISQFGTNNGGSSKFTVTLELPCSDGMLPGMNANVAMVLETIADCLTIPAEALVDRGTQTIVYTGYDEKTAELLNPVPVTVGLSDGTHVQILSGLEENASFWYSYYDTVEISTAVETRGMFG